MFGLETALKLPQKFDVLRMQKDLQKIDHWVMSSHQGPYHNVAWTGLCLVSKGGQINNMLDPEDELKQEKYQKTEILNVCPYFNQIIDSFPCQKHRVRLLALSPGGKIYEHFDSGVSIDSRIIRLHIPITTDPKVRFVLGMKSCYWKPGELWYGDFEFPHWLHNRSTVTRVHLVIDLPKNPDSLQIFDSSYIKQKQARIIHRKIHQKVYRIKKQSQQILLNKS